MDQIINKVASSGLISLDLEEFYPEGERVFFDLKDLLFQGLILKEKDFREFLKQHNWETYKDKYVAVFCTADAVIPAWAFMLLGIYLNPFAKKVIYGSLTELEEKLYSEIIDKLNIAPFLDARVVIKGCSNKPVPVSAYVDIVNKLRPVVKSLMFGEPCSTVPLYKKKD